MVGKKHSETEYLLHKTYYKKCIWIKKKSVFICGDI